MNICYLSPLLYVGFHNLHKQIHHLSCTRIQTFLHRRHLSLEEFETDLCLQEPFKNRNKVQIFPICMGITGNYNLIKTLQGR